MAGPGVLNAPTMTAERQRPPPLRLSGRHMVDGSVNFLGRTLRTVIHEGATVNELIEKAVKDNGGRIEKKFYPQFGTWEITSIEIDGLCLRKDVKGGLHFYIGPSGIPFAKMQDEHIVFPNGEELKVGFGTNNIYLDKTNDNFNPEKKEDFNSRYAGGVRETDAARREPGKSAEDAKKEAQQSHGGARSEKLLLPKNLLIIDKETGEICLISEHAAKAEGFAAPQFQTPEYTSVGLTMSSGAGTIAVPMDGSSTRVPYLFVKTFDGMITDHISVRFNPIRAYDVSLHRPKETVQNRSDATSLYFSILCREARATDSAPGLVQPLAIGPAKKAKPRPLHAPITPETVRYYWQNPRPPLQEDAGIAVSHPKLASLIKEKLRFLGVLFMLRRLLEKREPAVRKEAGKNKAQPEAEAPRRRKRRPDPPFPSMPEMRKKGNKKPKKAKPLPPSSVTRKKEKRAKQPLPLDAIRKKKEAKCRLPDNPKAGAVIAPKPLKAKPRAKRDEKKKRLPAYFMMGLLGLLPKRKRRFSRGRAAARN